MLSIRDAAGTKAYTDATTVRVEFFDRLAAATTRAATSEVRDTSDEKTHVDRVRLANHDCPASDEGGGTGDWSRIGAGGRGPLSFEAQTAHGEFESCDRQSSHKGK